MTSLVKFRHVSLWLIGVTTVSCSNGRIGENFSWRKMLGSLGGGSELKFKINDFIHFLRCLIAYFFMVLVQGVKEERDHFDVARLN